MKPVAPTGTVLLNAVRAGFAFGSTIDRGGAGPLRHSPVGGTGRAIPEGSHRAILA